MSEIRFPYSDTHVVLELPGSLPVRLLVPGKAGLPADSAGEIMRVLQNPVGTGPLPELAQAKKSAVIVVSDRTRLAPTHLFLPYLIEEIVKGGIRKENITVVVGVGAHREATAEEILSNVGQEVYSTVLCLSSSPSPAKCVVLGKTSRGTPLQIFRQVAEGDLKVATGNIEPHWMAAYSGGAKALVPGVAGLETIEKNHALSVKGQAVRDPDQNTVRADAEEAAEKLGLDFIFNVVTDHRGRLVQAFAGHPVRAHRAGCVLAGKLYYVSPIQPADIVLASAGGFPKDQSLYQAVKALQNAAAVVKPGGTIVLAASCREGFGNETFRHWAGLGLGEDELLERFARGFVLGAHKAALAAGITKKCRVYLVSDLSPKISEQLHFLPFPNMQQAFEAALRLCKGASPDIAAVPYAGLTFFA